MSYSIVLIGGLTAAITGKKVWTFITGEMMAYHCFNWKQKGKNYTKMMAA